MKNNLFTILIFLAGIQLVQAQSVNYTVNPSGSNQMPNMMLRVYPEFFIAPGDVELTLPINLVVDARYWAGSLADFRAGLSLGTNTGILLGGTLHLRDRLTTVKDKFVLSRTENSRTVSTKFLKVGVEARRISGPCADVFVGRQFGRFTSKIDIGWEWQSYMRNSIDLDNRTIQGNFNGFLSVKAQLVLQTPIATSKQITEATDGYYKVYDNKETVTGVGGQLDVTYAFRPWKFTTLYAGLAMGYLAAPNDGSAPILSIKIGVSLNKSIKLFSLDRKPVTAPPSN